MLSFRQKIFLTFVLVFLAVLALIFPGSTFLVNHFVYQALESRADEFISKIRGVTGDDAIVRRLRADQHLTFFRISVITDQRKVLYDSHSKRLLGPRFTQEFVVDHPEVVQAFEKGVGFTEDYSDLLGSKFVYLAKAFDFHGKRYVVRVAFPFRYVEDTTNDFKLAILLYSIVVLSSFSAITWLTIYQLSRPIQRIIEQVRGYQEQPLGPLPHIDIGANEANDDFSRLANTLNSLSGLVQRHIDTLTSERNEKAAVLDSLVEGVIAIDDSETIVYCNKIARQMFGIEDGELVGKPVSALSQEAAIAQITRSLNEKSTLTGTLQLSTPGGRIYLNMLSAPKGTKGGAILVLQDQSQHHRILNMRRQFIANASHELKTPITIIRGFAETLHDNPHLPQDTVQDITSKIVRHCGGMAMLIKDLLALSDIEHLSRSRLIEVDLVELLQQCRTTLLEVFPDAQVDIAPASAEDDYLLVADPSLMEMAFYNLLNNAAKYSDPPAKIKVSLTNVPDGVELLFNDQGIGIAEHELEHIFQRFYTIDSERTRKTGGSGLGLSIVETIIEKHYGQISVTSKVGVGTTFRIFLPRRDYPEEY